MIAQPTRSPRIRTRRAGRWGLLLLGLAFLAAFAPVAPVAPAAPAESRPPLRLVRTWTLVDGLPDNCIKAIQPARDGRLWLGTRQGLVCFDRDRMEIFTSTNAPALRNYEVSRLAEDAARTLWIGTPSGVVLHRNNRFERLDPNQVPDDSVNVFLPDTRSGDWVGFDRRLARRQNGRWTVYDSSRGMAFTAVNSLAEDHVGRIWIGCHAGLQRLTPTTGRFETIPLLAGIPAAHIQAIQCQPDGSTWVLAEMNPSPLFHLWRFVDGVWEDHSGEQPCLDGRLLLASSMQPGVFWNASTNWGLDRWVDPTSQELSTPPPALREGIWSLADDGRGNLWTGTFSSGLHLWRLPGTEAQPIPFAAIGRARLTPGAAWTLALGSGGGGLLLLVAGIGFHRRRVLRLRREAEESRVRDRQGLVRNLHDDLGSQLTRIAFLAGQSAPGASPADAAQSELARSVASAAAALRGFLAETDPLDPSLDGFLGQVSDQTQAFVEAAGLHFRQQLPDDPPPVMLSLEVRRELAAAIREAVHNAVRHASARVIRLGAHADARCLEIRVEDDGVGFGRAPANPASTGRGLVGMRHRLEQLGGECQVGPGSGRGTCVRFVLPLDR